MASKDKGHYGAKHSGGVVVAKEITEAVKKRSRQGALTCPLAFKIAGELAVAPGEVGKAMDLLEINIVKCQLGLFGYSPVRKIVPRATAGCPVPRSSGLPASSNSPRSVFPRPARS
jgi:hypothetical protein